MSSQHRLREKQQVYTLLAKLLSAMKALAYAELQKLQAQRQGQKNVLLAYRRVVSVLLQHGAVVPETKLPPLFIVVGSERGFCGDINRKVYLLLEESLRGQADAGLIFIGEKLLKLSGDRKCISRLSGAVVAEDVEPLVTGLVSVVVDSLSRYSFLDTRVIFLDDSNNRTALFPLIDIDFSEPAKYAGKGYGPLLYEAPEAILEKLLPEYFFATLQFCIKSALISENRSRYAHLQEATRHLDAKHEQLKIKMNQARRENIIEEIMVSIYNEDSLSTSEQAEAI